MFHTFNYTIMKYRSFYILFAILFASTSCNDYLDTNTLSVFTQGYIFEHEEDAYKAIKGVYALFNQDAYTSRVSNNFTGNTDVECGAISSTAPDNSRRDIWAFESTPANADLLTVWNNAYNAINRANECIEGIENSPLYKDGSSRMMKHFLGEALTLRAYWYYLLVNNWGDVPIKLTPTKAGDEFYLPKTDRNVIFSQLIDDLIKVEADMYWADELDFGIERINREFVLGMIARLALHRGGYSLYPDMTMKRSDDYRTYYEIANTYCKKLKSLKPHALNADFAQVFMNQVKYVVTANDDVLYEVAFYPGSGDVAWCNGIRVDGGTHAYGAGSNYLSFPPTYYYSFDRQDKRLPVTCALYYYDKNLAQQPVAYSAIAPGKWCRRWMTSPQGSASSKGTGINWPVMRYSDVLLMLAETENELNGGPTGEALEALRAVRQRAFAAADWATKVEDYMTAVSASKERFFEAIVDERSWEFGGECLRKYDLIRWNLYSKKVADTRNAVRQMGIDAFNGSGQYATLPDYFYYKTAADGTISFYDTFTKPAVAPPVKDSPNKGDNPNGYTRVSWLLGLYNTTTAAPADYVTRQWRGYTDDSGLTSLRYILPIHSSVITGSMGVLKNDGYGFNF